MVNIVLKKDVPKGVRSLSEASGKVVFREGCTEVSQTAYSVQTYRKELDRRLFDLLIRAWINYFKMASIHAKLKPWKNGSETVCGFGYGRTGKNQK